MVPLWRKSGGPAIDDTRPKEVEAVLSITSSWKIAARPLGHHMVSPFLGRFGGRGATGQAGPPRRFWTSALYRVVPVSGRGGTRETETAVPLAGAWETHIFCLCFSFVPGLPVALYLSLSSGHHRTHHHLGKG